MNIQQKALATREFFMNLCIKRSEVWNFIYSRIARLSFPHEIMAVVDTVNEMQWLYLHREMARLFLKFVKNYGGKDKFMEEVMRWDYSSNINAKLEEIWGEDLKKATSWAYVNEYIERFANEGKNIIHGLYWGSKQLLDELDELEKDKWFNLCGKERLSGFISNIDAAVTLLMHTEPDMEFGEIISILIKYHVEDDNNTQS